MRADAVAAERHFEVREAARAWRRADAIDDATLRAIEADHRDDRVRLGPVFRVLVFVFALIAVTALNGLFLLVSPSRDMGPGLILFLGIALVVLTEVQVGPLRRTQAGAEAATALSGVLHLISGFFWLAHRSLHLGTQAELTVVLSLAAVTFGLAAYRWGYVTFAMVAGAAFFLLLARTRYGRLTWIAVPLVAAPLLVRLGDAASLAPAHRRCGQALAVVALAFLYVAVHLGSWDVALVEHVRDDNATSTERSEAIRSLLAVVTGLLPVFVIGWGLAARRRLLIGAGLVGLIASIVTLRAYVHVAPLWIALVTGGGAALVLALALRRYLDSGLARERNGFTAEPLFTDPERRSTLEMAAGMAAFSPAARPAERPGLEAGGGRFGGGGATGTY
jgi:hypothetical protein